MEEQKRDWIKTYTEDYVSCCCQAKMIVTRGKYELKFYCTKCEMPTTPEYSEIEKFIFKNACVLEGDGDDYDSWDAYFWNEEVSPYEFGIKLKEYINKNYVKNSPTKSGDSK